MDLKLRSSGSAEWRLRAPKTFGANLARFTGSTLHTTLRSVGTGASRSTSATSRFPRLVTSSQIITTGNHGICSTITLLRKSLCATIQWTDVKLWPSAAKKCKTAMARAFAETTANALASMAIKALIAQWSQSILILPKSTRRLSLSPGPSTTASRRAAIVLIWFLNWNQPRQWTSTSWQTMTATLLSSCMIWRSCKRRWSNLTLLSSTSCRTLPATQSLLTLSHMMKALTLIWRTLWPIHTQTRPAQLIRRAWMRAGLWRSCLFPVVC